MVYAVPDSYYVYSPTKGVSIVFAVLFTISGVLHIWQNNVKYRSWRIGFLLPWAALLRLCIGLNHELVIYLGLQALFVMVPLPHHFHPIYALRYPSKDGGAALHLFPMPGVYSDQNDSLPQDSLFESTAPIIPTRSASTSPAKSSSSLLHLSIRAPTTLSSDARFTISHTSPLSIQVVCWTTFVALDTIDGILAGNGAALAANQENPASKIHIGIILVKVSLFLLLVMFLGFVTLIVNFHRRAVDHGVFNRKIRIVIYTMYASSLLILLRNCFRTATFFYSYNSVANGEEWPFWVFEALPMLCNSIMLNVWPPAKYLPANHKVYLAIDGKTELVGPGMVDKRPFLASLFDPFDLIGLFRGKDNKNRFWETDGIGGPKANGDAMDTGAPEVEEARVKGNGI